jgi:DNA-binding LacI/PurR family transcriptional regulator
MEFDSAATRTLGSLTIGVYTPYLQGFYIGELVNQLRQLCFVKGYRLVVIRTGGYGKFQSALQLEQIDCAIFIRNAVSAEFAESLLRAGKPCVAISYDYFPLSIPVVSSDNQFGVSLAMDHLLKAGCNKIAFVGDLSQYDLRKRYEYYCDAHDQYQLPLNERYLFTVDDTQFNGGRQAAGQFIGSGCDANGIIFGAGLTGIGFLQYIRQTHPDVSARIQGVCFDALSLIPVLTPDLASVDQNLNLIAYRAINVLEAQLSQKDITHHIQVEPKLTYINRGNDSNSEAFIATCVDLPELHNPNYTKALLANMHEWPREIVASGLDQIMSIAPLFERFMGMAFLCRHFIDNNQKAWIKQIKSFVVEGVVKTDLSDSSSLCREEKFPPVSLRQILQPQYDFQLHVPIQLNGKIWGFLSTVGHTAVPTNASSFFGFGGYIETIVRLFEQDLEIKTLHKKIADCQAPGPSQEIAPDREASITWDFDEGLTVWSEKALQKLGFQSAMELNIYSNMDITDRIHKDDLPNIRDFVSQSKSNKSAFHAQLRYKMKNGQFTDAILEGEPTLDAEQKMTGMVFYLGVNHVL